MLEEGELDHNSKIFDEKVEEGYGVLRDRTSFITERSVRSPKYKKERGGLF